jgi:hypothetical protein
MAMGHSAKSGSENWNSLKLALATDDPKSLFATLLAWLVKPGK